MTVQPSFLIVGLGNPGAEYDHTRHNVGYDAVDVFGATFGTGDWRVKPSWQAQVRDARVRDVPVLLCKPLTYMNLSGVAIRSVVDFYKLNPSHQLLVCCDDVDLPLGTLRLRQTGGPGTHNGLKSVVAQFGRSVPRLRIGIGPQAADTDLASWVLSRMPADDRMKLHVTFGTLSQILDDFIHEQMR